MDWIDLDEGCARHSVSGTVYSREDNGWCPDLLTAGDPLLGVRRASTESERRLCRGWLNRGTPTLGETLSLCSNGWRHRQPEMRARSLRLKSAALRSRNICRLRRLSNVVSRVDTIARVHARTAGVYDGVSLKHLARRILSVSVLPHRLRNVSGRSAYELGKQFLEVIDAA